MLILLQVGVAMSDPFGGEDIDFDLDKMMLASYTNANGTSNNSTNFQSTSNNSTNFQSTNCRGGDNGGCGNGLCTVQRGVRYKTGEVS